MSLDKLGGSVNNTEGAISETMVFDDRTHQALLDVLAELKLMNIQLSFITDEKITEKDR